VKRQIRESFRLLAKGALGSFDYNVVVPKTKKMSHPYLCSFIFIIYLFPPCFILFVAQGLDVDLNRAAAGTP
jgi:hypothetical protein